jgi:hypothetical protein
MVGTPDVDLFRVQRTRAGPRAVWALLMLVELLLATLYAADNATHRRLVDTRILTSAVR